MDNLQKYNKAFTDTFKVDEDAVVSLEYQSIPRWDSVGHMELVAELEDAFDIMMETDDIIDFSSYAKGKELLAKYNITV